MSIIIGADIVPTESNRYMFEYSEIESLIGHDLYEVLQEANYLIFNLEVPLTNALEPIHKQGSTLSAPTNCINGLKDLNINLLALANNHIMDQGVQGLTSTIKTIEQAGISHVGTGDNLKKAKAPVYFNVDGKRYGVYACAEHEFSIAGENTPGANPFDPLESPDHVSLMKEQCDYAIVLYHGGKEYYRYPSPNLQKTCRKLIEKGADIVVCQHSHCIGCEEKYLNGTIVYGQGNFIFDDGDDVYWNTGLLVCIEDEGQIKYVPLEKKGNCIRMAAGKSYNEILESFKKRSLEITTPGFLQKEYREFSEEHIGDYIIYFLGIHNHFVYRAINRISGQRLKQFIVKRIINKCGLGMRNYIECEAHRDLFLKGLEYNENN